MINRLGQPVAIAVALAAVTMAACDSSSRTSVGPSPVKCQVTLATSAETVASNGGGGTVDVTTNPECAWAASPSATWISSLSPANGQGNGQIQYRAVANPQPAMRQADIDVNGSRVSIRQEATPCQFDITPSTQAIDDRGGTGTIALTTLTGCGWNATSHAEWITVTGGQSGNRSGAVTFRVDANPGTERTGTMSVGDDTFTVIQEGALVCGYALEPAEGTVDGAGAQGSFVVATQPECSWTAASTAPWISVTSGSTGAGRAPVGFVVAPNTGDTRSGTITVASVAFTVTQRPSVESCNFSITPAVRTVGSPGGLGAPLAVSAAAGCSWTAVSTVPWITIASGGNGSGSGSVTYVVAPNSGPARTGAITIGNRTFTLTQDAEPAACGFVLSPASRSFDAAGGSGSLAVSSACAWTAVSNVPWIAITSGATGTGSGAVGYTVAANGGGSRTGTVTIGNQTFTIQQDAAPGPCSFAISPSRDTVDAGGGTGAVITVATNAGCVWTASSNDSWLSITFGANGTGSGGVRFSAAPNGGAERTGTLTVAGNAFSVTQRGASTGGTCSFAVAPTSASFGQLGGSTSTTVTTTAGCTWTAASNDSWISVTSGASGNGSGQVAFAAAVNLGAARSGSLSVAGRTVTVSQAALVSLPTCSYGIAPGQLSAGSGGGSGNTVTVTATAGCAWTASSNAPWLTIASGGNGTGNGTLVFSVDANSGIARVGTLTIAGQTFTVTQAAGAASPCTYAVNPLSQTVGALGGTTSFSVTTTAGCAWSASSQTLWISITSGGSGSGNGTVTVAVGINLLGQRSGTVSIAGQSVTVSQNGVLD